MRYGSTLAVKFAIESLGKNPDVIIPEYSKKFDFLPGIEDLKKESSISRYDLAISLDCADTKILKGYSKYYEGAKKRINIDHHSSNTMYGDINFVNPVAPACSEILIEMFEYFGIKITKTIGTCIMTGIVTDTGGFRINSTPETFEFTSELVRTGINMKEIFRKTLQTRSRANFELNRRAMNRIEFLEGGKVSFTYITEEDEIEVEAETGDHEGIVEQGRNIEDVEVSIFLHPAKEKGYKVSLRSLEYVDVSKIALKLGGGGHINAAGAFSKGSIEEIKEKVIKEVRKELK